MEEVVWPKAPAALAETPTTESPIFKTFLHFMFKIKEPLWVVVEEEERPEVILQLLLPHSVRVLEEVGERDALSHQQPALVNREHQDLLARNQRIQILLLILLREMVEQL